MSTHQYPEHEKLKALGGANQIIGDFIEWLGENEMLIAQYANDTELMPARMNRDDLLAEHFGINRLTLEAEKRNMLDEIRKANGAQP